MKTKNLLLVALAAFALTLQTSCKSKNNNKIPIEVTQNEQVNEVDVTELTKDGFIENIYDFVTFPTEFKYVGTHPAMIQFYATWCAPCKTFSPIMAEVAKMYKGKIKTYKIDIDKEPDLSALFNVTAVPTTVFITKEGKMTMVPGAMSKEELEAKIKEYLAM